MEKLNEFKTIQLSEGEILSKEDLLNLYRLQKVLLEERDIVANLQECCNIWQNHSWDLSASWLCFPDDDISILNYIEGSYNFTSYEEYSKI